MSFFKKWPKPFRKQSPAPDRLQDVETAKKAKRTSGVNGSLEQISEPSQTTNPPPRAATEEASIKHTEPIEDVAVAHPKDIGIQSHITDREQTTLDSVIRPTGFVQTGDHASAIFNGSYYDVQGNFIVYSEDKLKNLNTLAEAKGASWSAHHEDFLENTRVDIINEIMDWVDNAKTAQIMCVRAVAGAGKTALSTEVARRLQKAGILVASFFFRHDSEELSTPDKLFATFACHLATVDRAVAERICASMDSDPSLASNFSARQFEEWIVGPSHLIPDTKPRVFVIDAADECRESNQFRELLKVLNTLVPKLPNFFRIILTTRSTPLIMKSFVGQPHIIIKSLDLRTEANMADITFIRIKLAEVAFEKCEVGSDEWAHDEKLIHNFASATEGSFIWATTAIEFLRGAFQPQMDLEELLARQSGSQGLEAEEKLYDLYMLALKRLNWRDRRFVAAFQAVMGMIVVAKEPLTISALASMNPAVSLSEFKRVLEELYAVLYYSEDKPIRLLHKSFHDFITTRGPNEPHHIATPFHEESITRFCLSILNQQLNRPIDGTGYLDSEGGGIPKLPDGSVSEELWYCCQFWTSHCCSLAAPVAALDRDAIENIVDQHFSTWVEIAASKGTFNGVNQHFLRWLEKSIWPDARARVYTPMHSQLLHRLSAKLSYENRYSEALSIIEPVVDLYKEIAASNPSAFKSDLALYLSNLSTRQLEMGLRKDALDTIEQAVELYQQLAALNPASFKSELALCLNDLSRCQSKMGLQKEALDTIKQSVNLYEQLAVSNPASFKFDQARSRHNLSLYQSRMGLRKDALETIEQAVELYKQLSALNPAAFKSALAQSLNSLSSRQSEMGLRKEALDTIQHAVDLYKQLAASHPTAVKSSLARSLGTLSNRQFEMGLPKDALETIEQAVKLYTELAALNPAAFASDLAGFLNNLSIHQSKMGLQNEALESIEQAIEIGMQLAASNPAAFKPDLARYLHSLSTCQFKMGLQTEALNTMKQVVELYQQLAALNPAGFNSNLAESINSLSICQSRVGLRKDALDTVEQAVGLYKQLAASNPAAFKSHLAHSLHTLANRQFEIGLPKDSLETIEQAVELYKQLVALNPAAFTSDLARSLNDLSTHQSKMGLQKEALQSIEQAANIRTQLAASNPTVLNSDLARSLYDLSIRQSEMSLRKEALDTIEKAVELYKPLAVSIPKAFNADLASSLLHLSNCLSDVGRLAEAQGVKAQRLVIASFRCDSCHRHIEGATGRHRCNECDDFDLCHTCWTSGKAESHIPGHSFAAFYP